MLTMIDDRYFCRENNFIKGEVVVAVLNLGSTSNVAASVAWKAFKKENFALLAKDPVLSLLLKA